MSCQPQPKRSRTTISPSDAPDISLSPRDHEFSSTSWWLVDVESNDVITQGATPLVKRCMRVYNWDLAKTRRVLNAYRQFLHLKKCYEDWDATQLSPSHLVDQMWHQHILDVTNYCHDVMLLCGHVVGHNPDGTMDYGGKIARDLNTRGGLIEHFKDSFDREIWGIQSNADTGNAAGNQSEAGSNTTSAEDNALTIRVKDQSGEEIFFKVKTSTTFEKIYRAYASHKRVKNENIRLLLDGDNIDPKATPSMLGLKDQDQIDAECHYTTGSAACKQSEAVLNNAYAEERANRELTIIVRDQTGEKTNFKIMATTRMEKIFGAYASQKGVDACSLLFLIDGDRIDDYATPLSLKLEDQDKIDVLLVQSGC